MTTRPGDLICDIVCSISRKCEESEECPSTQDCINGLEVAEERIEREAVRLVMGSIDAEAMYTNMDMNMAAIEVAKKWLESGMLIENMDVRNAQVFIASSLS